MKEMFRIERRNKIGKVRKKQEKVRKTGTLNMPKTGTQTNDDGDDEDKYDMGGENDGGA